MIVRFSSCYMGIIIMAAGCLYPYPKSMANGETASTNPASPAKLEHTKAQNELIENFILAIIGGNDDYVLQALTQGMDPNVLSGVGLTPLMYAVSAPVLTPYYKKVISLLLVSKANPDMQDKEGRTALMHAVQAGHEEAVQMLLSARANPHIKDLKGKTALDYARGLGKPELISLLEHGENKNPNH